MAHLLPGLGQGPPSLRGSSCHLTGGAVLLLGRLPLRVQVSKHGGIGVQTQVPTIAFGTLYLSRGCRRTRGPAEKRLRGSEGTLYHEISVLGTPGFWRDDKKPDVIRPYRLIVLRYEVYTHICIYIYACIRVYIHRYRVVS